MRLRQVSSARLFFALLIGLVLALLEDPSGWSGVAFRRYLVAVLMEALILARLMGLHGAALSAASDLPDI